MKNLNPNFFISIILIFIINIMFLFGALHIIAPIFAYLLLFIITIVSIIYFRNYKFPNIFNFYKSLSSFEKILFFFAVFIFITTLIRCFAPITGMDTLTARVNDPKRFIQHGGFVNLPNVLGSNLPMGTEMLYMFSMLILPYISVNFIAFSISLLLVLAIYSFSEEFFNKKIGFLTAILIISTQVFYAQSWSSLEDMALAYFSFVTMWSLFRYFKMNSINYMVLFGILSGTTVVIKFNGAIFISLLYLILLIKLLKTKKIHYILLPFILSIIVYLPWAIKAYLYTGNPLYPYFNSLFNLKIPYNYFDFNKLGSSEYSLLNNMVYFFTNFLNVTILPIQINKYYSTLNGMASPIILILFIIAIYYKFWQNKYLKYFVPLIFFTYLVHFILLNVLNGPPLRYYFIIFVLLSIIGAWGYYQIKSKLLNRTNNIIIMGWLLFFTIYTTYKKVLTYPVVFGIESKVEFHEHSKYGFRPYEDFKYLNKTVKNNDKVLLFDPRGYYLDPDYVTSRNIYLILKNKNLYNLEALHKYLYINNIKYIWFDDDLKDQDRKQYYFLLGLTKEMIKKYNWKIIYLNKKFNSYVYTNHHKNTNNFQ